MTLVKGGWLEADDTDHLRIEPVEVRVIRGVRALELRFEEIDPSSEVPLTSAHAPGLPEERIGDSDRV